MRRGHAEDGFTLIETMIAIVLVGIVTTSLYQVMLSGIRGSETSRSVVRQSEEARLGFNRMIRDTREAGSLTACTPSSFSNCYRVQIDFDNDGSISNPNARGDYEDLIYAYSSSDREVTLNGQTLIGGVYPVPGHDIFDYQSNALEYDADGDGTTSAAELDASGVGTVGNGNGILDEPELSYVTGVGYAFRVKQGKKGCAATASPEDPCEAFYGAAQLRNRR